jgi:hypothetical protein
MISREFHTRATNRKRGKDSQHFQNIGRVPFQKLLLSSQLYTACNTTILICGSNFSSRLQIHILDSGALWSRAHPRSPPFSETQMHFQFQVTVYKSQLQSPGSQFNTGGLSNTTTKYTLIFNHPR